MIACAVEMMTLVRVVEEMRGRVMVVEVGKRGRVRVVEVEMVTLVMVVEVGTVFS